MLSRIAVLFLIFKFSETCTPVFNTPLLSPVVQNPQLLNSPILPPTSFQMDSPNSITGNVPNSDDYSDSFPVSVQKDSILPLHQEKSKLHFSVFDLFRPLVLSTAPPTNIFEKKMSKEISMNVTFSPPVHWTYCDPICGVGDQAVDSDNAYENAIDDVTEAIKSACSASNTKWDMSSFQFQYQPESILTEDFGSYFDLRGNRYRISGKTVAFRINNQNPGFITSFTISMKIKFSLESSIDESQTKTIKQKIIDYLASRKSLHIAANYI